MIAYADIEADGLLHSITKIHCLCFAIDDGEVKAYNDCAPEHRDGTLAEGIFILLSADEVWFHNGICYDKPAIHKVLGVLLPRVMDSLTLSHLVYPELGVTDVIKYRTLPKKHVNKHSLAAWGMRLKLLKGDFAETADWKEWSLAMQEYCKQDVVVLRALVTHLKAQNFSAESIDIEMKFQEIIFRQEQCGFPFNYDKALELDAMLSIEKQQVLDDVAKHVEYLEKKSVFIPKKDNTKLGYVAGKPYIKVRNVKFNVGSRDQIVQYLKEKYKWNPVDFTDKGKPSLTADVLESLPWDECKLFSKYQDIIKVKGRIKDGDASWINSYRDGKVYGRMSTNGAVTGRCTHQVIANIPSSKAYLGPEVRALFGPLPGHIQVGCDAKAIELRLLAGYMARYDGGAYIDTVLHGDVHTENQKAAGLATRDEAKRFIYAFLYGAGDAKLGSIVAPTDSAELQKFKGRQIRRQFMANLPALATLISNVRNAAKERGYLLGLDGRKLYCRAEYSALNTLLQGAGAVVMKKACIIAWDMLEAEGFRYGEDVVQLIHYHDEYQFSCREEIAERVGTIVADAITKAGDHFKFRCRLDGDWKKGNNWKECH